uniref:PA domain-containing protein n=1 Tax=Fagus sylvatica TaxID=28930 RepID=A0A2N9I5A4_FAGSY
MAVSSWPNPRFFAALIILILISLSFVAADDVKLDDDDSPKSPSCNNPCHEDCLPSQVCVCIYGCGLSKSMDSLGPIENIGVRVKNWVGDAEGKNLAGLSARFGALLPSQAEKAPRLPAVFAHPLNCCSSSSSKLSGSIVLSIRGGCDFTKKAEVAQSGGAAALVVINDQEELYKMVCSDNDTALNLSIPVVMIPKSAGEALNKSMASGHKGA